MTAPKPPPRVHGLRQADRPEYIRRADGCPCNSRRGINHGLVARDVCTCDVCDPSQSGCSRVKRLETNMSLAPAFDVEALVAAFEARLVRDSRGTLYSPWAASEALRSVAREMRKGGVK